jgi:hypothetical protein
MTPNGVEVSAPLPLIHATRPPPRLSAVPSTTAKPRRRSVTEIATLNRMLQFGRPE